LGFFNGFGFNPTSNVFSLIGFNFYKILDTLVFLYSKGL
jgi:hypothetical protein